MHLLESRPALRLSICTVGLFLVATAIPSVLRSLLDALVVRPQSSGESPWMSLWASLSEGSPPAVSIVKLCVGFLLFLCCDGLAAWILRRSKPAPEKGLLP